MRRLVLFVPLVLFAVMALLFKVMIGHDPTELDLARKGQALPDFTLTDLQNPEQRWTQADLLGKPYLLNVWATWCPSCRAEHPVLVDLAQREGVRIVGLNYKDDRAAAQQWLVKLGDPYALTLFDEEGRFGLDLGVYGAPETYVVDAQGTLLYRHVGVVTQDVWRNTLAPLLNGPAGGSQ
ncbi:MAG: DsbE family thiol:disulfide interchange protein [Hahellaceae bacterium]|nr:DsbE family thiol:disulfide interchange protein [Hahellaceae bacterium]